MVESIGFENIVVVLVFVIMLLLYQLERFTKCANDNIDKLQKRVHELEDELNVRS